jgi:hypothetical protein
VQIQAASLPVLLVAVLLGGCAGQPCGDLAGLRAERDEARAAYARLVEPGSAASELTAKADEDLHALDRRVFDLEQSCAGR